MCETKEYESLYLKTEQLLRLEGLNATMPGYEIAKRAIVMYKIDGKEYEDYEKNKFYEEVRLSMSSPIPSINPVITNRHPVEQWILELLRGHGIEDSAMSFVKDIANQI